MPTDVLERTTINVAAGDSKPQPVTRTPGRTVRQHLSLDDLTVERGQGVLADGRLVSPDSLVGEVADLVVVPLPALG